MLVLLDIIYIFTHMGYKRERRGGEVGGTSKRKGRGTRSAICAI